MTAGDREEWPVEGDLTQAEDNDLSLDDAEPTPASAPAALKRPKVNIDWSPRNPHEKPWHMDPTPIDHALVCEAFRQIQHEAHRNAVDHGFWHAKTAQTHGAEKIALMHSELSEALEAMRSGRWQDTPRPATAAEVEKFGRSTVVEEGVGSELADVVIRVLDLCGAAHIDLGALLLAKLEKNKGRPPMHGKGF
jgi:hypothetical protein